VGERRVGREEKRGGEEEMREEGKEKERSRSHIYFVS
jgi:hypothetical protein